MEPTGHGFVGYLVTGTLGRAALKAAGPAILVAIVAARGSASTASYVVAAMTAAAAIGGPLTGLVIDRATHPRRTFALALTLLAIGLSGIALVLDTAPLMVILGLAAVGGLAHPALSGGWSAQLPALLPPARMARGYSADAATYSIAAVLAPPVVAAVVVVTDSAPLWLSALLAVVAIAALPLVPLPRRSPDQHTTRLRADIREGLHVLFSRPSLRRTTIITVLGFAAQASFFVLAPVLAESRFDGLAFAGVIIGAFAVGGAISALWFTHRPVVRPDRAVIATTLISGVALLGLGLSSAPAGVLIGAFVMGAAEPPGVASMFRVRIREAPTHVHGQVFTTSATLRITGFAIVTALSGWLLHWGVGAVIAFGVALHLIAVAAGVAWGPHLPRRHHWLTRQHS